MAKISAEIRNAYILCAQAIIVGNNSIDSIDEVGIDTDFPIFSVGLTAKIADIHSQTLRQYDRLGLIVPQRTEGGARRYSLRDIDRLVQAQRMSQEESINLAGIAKILALQEENRQLRRQVRRLKSRENSIFSAAADGEVIEIHRSKRARDWRRNAVGEQSAGRHSAYAITQRQQEEIGNDNAVNNAMNVQQRALIEEYADIQHTDMQHEQSLIETGSEFEASSRALTPFVPAYQMINSQLLHAQDYPIVIRWDTDENE